MNHHKSAKTIGVILALACFLFAGCGSGIAADTQPNNTKAQENIITAMPTALTAATPTDKPAVTVVPAKIDIITTILPTRAPATPEPPQKAGKLQGLIIGVDAGHQEKGDSTKEPVAPGSNEMKARVSSGTRGVESKVYEYVVNLQVALKLQALLEAEGATVIMVRTTHDVNISNKERAEMMNEAKADLVIRLHCNGSDTQSVNGTLMMTPATGSHQDASYRASELILKEVLALTGAKDMGIQKHSDMTGFNWSTVPSTLIEMGFMTNPQEDLNLNNDAYQDKLAQGMLNGIIKYFEER